MQRTTLSEKPTSGSILLPVLIVLLLVASAATAMTLQMSTSLREKATRRDRLALTLMADALARSAGLALTQAATAKHAAPFPVDGTPVACLSRRGLRLLLSVQDQGGLIDLNKAPEALLPLVLGKTGLSGPSVNAITRAIVARRTGAEQRSRPQPPGRRGSNVDAGSATTMFDSPDQLDVMPGVSTAVFERIRPLFTTQNGTAGFDPRVAAPALRRLIPPRELQSPTFEPYTNPSMAATFDVEAGVTRPTGLRVTRSTLFKLGLNTGDAGQHITWDAPVSIDEQPEAAPSSFCQTVLAALQPDQDP